MLAQRLRHCNGPSLRDVSQSSYRCFSLPLEPKSNSLLVNIGPAFWRSKTLVLHLLCSKLFKGISKQMRQQSRSRYFELSVVERVT